jgi:hypothetical protein
VPQKIPKNPRVRARRKIQRHFVATSGVNGLAGSYFKFHWWDGKTRTRIEHNAIIRDVWTLHNTRFPLITQTSQSKLTISKKEALQFYLEAHRIAHRIEKRLTIARRIKYALGLNSNWQY